MFHYTLGGNYWFIITITLWTTIDSLLSSLVANQREWFFPFSAYETLVNKLQAATNLNVAIKRIPDKIPKILNAFPPVDVTNEKSIDWNRIPKKLIDVLKPFQRQGIWYVFTQQIAPLLLTNITNNTHSLTSFGIHRQGRFLLADEMGLGKTLQALTVAYYYRDQWPLLIICPSSLRFNWSKEIESWLLPLVQPHEINIIMQGKKEFDKLVNIVSYDLALKMVDKISNKKFKVVIADECHYLKNVQAQRTSAILPVLKSSPHAIMITGTPALSRPSELYTQLSALLEPKCDWLTRMEYIYRYCDAQDTVHTIVDKGSSNLRELNFLLSRTIMIRRQKSSVLNELPPKYRSWLYLGVKKSI